MNQSTEVFRKISDLGSYSHQLSPGFEYFALPLPKIAGSFMLIPFLFFVEFKVRSGKLTELQIIQRPTVVRWGVYLVLCVSILVFGVFDINEFIYFQF